MVPSCRKQWGLELPIPPCQALAPEMTEYLEFPPTCECLTDCQAINVRVVYVDKCVNTSSHGLAAFNDLSVPLAQRDPFGDGKWLRKILALGVRRSRHYGRH